MTQEKSEMKRLSSRSHAAVPQTRGQVLVEFAIVLPFLLLLAAAIIDFGFLFYDYVATHAGCREAALAMIQGYNDGSPIYLEADLKKIAKKAHGPFNPLTDDEITITSVDGSNDFGPPARTVRTVTIIHNHPWITPVMIPFSNSIQIKSLIKGYVVKGYRSAGGIIIN